jgi:hypothetical protein
MLNRYLVVIGLSFGFAVSAPPVHPASVYKWVDEKGVTQYSTTPPPGKPAQEIKVQPEVTPGTEPESKGVPEQPTAPTPPGTDGEGKQPDDKQRAEQKAIGEKVCQELRDNLARLQQYARIYEKDDKGEVTWLTEEQRQQRTEETQKQIKEFCE